MSNSIEKEWTVFFLAKAIGKADTENLIDLIKDIEGIDFGDQINVIFCVNFSRVYMDGLMNLDKESICQDVKANFTTMFFKLIRRKNLGNRLCLIGEKEDFDITHTEDVSVFFKQYVLEHNLARKYFLFTWDHGNGFRIFSGIGRGGQPSDDSGKNDILTMDELGTAINHAFDNSKIDLVVMMNCYMQMYDTSYALCHCVDYLVAPQSFVEFNDYDYKGIFDYLANDPQGVTGENMGSYIIENFRQRRFNSTVAISCIDLSYDEAVYDISRNLDSLAKVLIKNVKKGQVGEILKKFTEAFTITGTRLIDLGSLLYQFVGFEGLNTDEQKAVKKYLEHMRSLVIDQYTNADCSGSDICYNGFTTVSPVPTKSHNEAFELDNFEYYLWKSKFLRNSTWGELIYVLDILDN